MPEVIETIETPEEAAGAEVIDLFGAAATDDTETRYITVLETWRELLKPGAKVLSEKPHPNWCIHMITSYVGLDFKDMLAVRDEITSRFELMRTILDLELDGDEECMKKASREEDIEENRAHYKNLIYLWQAQVQQWELEWDCTDPDAAITLAALGEIHKMFLGEQGLIRHLDAVQFPFDQSDQEELVGLLTEHRDSVLGVGGEQ